VRRRRSSRADASDDESRSVTEVLRRYSRDNKLLRTSIGRTAGQTPREHPTTVGCSTVLDVAPVRRALLLRLITEAAAIAAGAAARSTCLRAEQSKRENPKPPNIHSNHLPSHVVWPTSRRRRRRPQRRRPARKCTRGSPAQILVGMRGAGARTASERAETQGTSQRGNEKPASDRAATISCAQSSSESMPRDDADWESRGEGGQGKIKEWYHCRLKRPQ
jgi:hypothetical protein